MTNKILLKKSSVPGKVPTDLDFGEVALNYADGKLYYKTSTNDISSLGGGSAGFTQIDRKSYVATSGQTTFAVTYAGSFVDVYINGSHLGPLDYTATSGSNIVLTSAAALNDEIDVVGYSGIVLSTAPVNNGDMLIYNSTSRMWENVAGTTSNITEGSNLYFTTARARASISASDGITYDSSSGALTLTDSGVTAGSYGSASTVPVITVDANGRITSASTTAVAGVSNVQYDSSTGVITVSTSSGTDYTVDLGIGTADSPTFAGSVTLTNSRIQSDTVTTTATTADQVLVSLAGATYRSAEFVIQASDTTNGKYHTTTVKAIHNGTTANSTEFGSVNIGGVCATFTADYSGGNLRLLCTPASTASTVYKITSIIAKL